MAAPRGGEEWEKGCRDLQEFSRVWSRSSTSSSLRARSSRTRSPSARRRASAPLTRNPICLQRGSETQVQDTLSLEVLGADPEAGRLILVSGRTLPDRWKPGRGQDACTMEAGNRRSRHLRSKCGPCWGMSRSSLAPQLVHSPLKNTGCGHSAAAGGAGVVAVISADGAVAGPLAITGAAGGPGSAVRCRLEDGAPPSPATASASLDGRQTNHSGLISTVQDAWSQVQQYSSVRFVLDAKQHVTYSQAAAGWQMPKCANHPYSCLFECGVSSALHPC